VQGFKPEIWEGSGEMAADWRGERKGRRKMRGAPFESYVVMEAVEWDVPSKPRKVCVDER